MTLPPCHPPVWSLQDAWQSIFGDTMTISACIRTLLPEVDPLRGLIQPETGASFRPLDPDQLIGLAERAINRLSQSGIQQIIVCESGAIPFAKICAWVAEKQSLALAWHSLKVPRNLALTFDATFHACLHFSAEDLQLAANPRGFTSLCEKRYGPVPEGFLDPEGRSLKQLMTALKQDPPLAERKHFLSITKNTPLAKILGKPFVLFDEYIDSGRTLFQSLRFFSLFSESLQFRVFSYLTKMDQAEMDASIHDSLYANDDAACAYAEGVYPFENRLDYLGYFYQITPREFSRITLSGDFAREEDREGLETLTDLLSQQGCGPLLQQVKAFSRIPEIAAWISPQQLAVYLIYWMEKTLFGSNAISEFWYQVFDMYGPMWSPFPDAWHLDYLEAFSGIGALLDQSEFLPVSHYRRHRKQLVHEAALLLEMRRLQHENLFANYRGVLQ